MFTRKIKNIGKKGVSVLLTVSVLFYIATFFPVFTSFSGEHRSFDSATEIVETGTFYEIRRAADSTLLERLFLHMPNMPYMDYLLREDTNGNIQYIALHEENSLLELAGIAGERLLGLLKKKASLVSGIADYVSEMTFLILFTIVLLLGRSVQASNGFMLFRHLSLAWRKSHSPYQYT